MAWFLIIMVGLILYVSLDGNDLGIGILAITRRDDSQRQELLKLVAPVWDGAESWILLVAVGLWGGFPAATGALLPAIYLPIVVMLWSLFMRGVSIEMITNGRGWTRSWGLGFMAGSLAAAFAQGVLIGAVVQGVRLGPNSVFVGGTWDFLSGYTVLTGLTTVVLFCLSGAAMIKMRADDAALRSMARTWGRPLVGASIALVALCGSLLPVAGASSLRLDQPFRGRVAGECLPRGLDHAGPDLVEHRTTGPRQLGLRRLGSARHCRRSGPGRPVLPDDRPVHAHHRPRRVPDELA